MKTATLLVFIATLGFAQDRTKPAKETKPAPAADSSRKDAPAIPEGAVQVEPFLYRYTDAKGKTWMYRKTPFGVSKWEDTGTPEPAKPAAEADPVTATDLGDSVRFERKTPFGRAKWVRKKTELTADEQKLVSAAKNGASAGDSKEKH